MAKVFLRRLGTQLAIEDDVVRCQLNADTKDRPVSVDTVFEALLSAEPAMCVDVFATDDSGWNQSQCSESEAEGSCGFAPQGFAGAGLTTAALLAMVLTYRRRRPR